MMLEILTVYHGCGMQFTIDELQELMPEEVEAVFERQQEMLARIFPG